MIKIRFLDLNDIPELTALAKKTYTDTFGHLLPDDEIEQTINETRSEECFLEDFRNDIFLGAMRENALIGYIQISALKYAVESIETHKSDQSINALYVHKDYQGQGIGTQLMDTALEHSRLKNLNRVFLDVWEKNEKAVSFYLNYGFIEVGKCAFTIKGKIVGYDLVFMKEINQ